jgi:hypothetical protein
MINAYYYIAFLTFISSTIYSLHYFVIDNNSTFDTLKSMIMSILNERKKMRSTFRLLTFFCTLFSMQVCAALKTNKETLTFLRVYLYLEELEALVDHHKELLLLDNLSSEVNIKNFNLTSAAFNKALIHNNYPDIIKFLYLRPKTNFKNAYGQTSLHYACTLSLDNKKTQKIAYIVVKILLLYGFNPNIPDNEGNTPLHTAIDHFYIEPNNESLEIIKALLNHNANPNIKNKEGESALDKALKIPWFYKNEKITEQLIQILIIKSDRSEWLQYLIKVEKLFREAKLYVFMHERFSDIQTFNTLSKTPDTLQNQRRMYLYGNILSIFDKLLK